MFAELLCDWRNLGSRHFFFLFTEANFYCGLAEALELVKFFFERSCSLILTLQMNHW